MGYYSKTRRVQSSQKQRRHYSSRQPNAGRRRRGQYINPARFIKEAQPVTHDEYNSTYTFSDFKLHPILAKNLLSKGYQTPSPIQDQTIPLILEGKDIVGIAATGTGKTGAFAIPLLHKLLSDKQAKVLIVTPTRELAQQVFTECHSIAKGANIDAAVLIGGSPMGRQLRDLRANPQIAIGTPGRIKDHLERRTLKLDTFNHIVLDEVDRMLDMGFVNDIRTILNHVTKKRQSLFFSATLDNRVRGLIETFSNNPQTVKLQNNDTSVNVHQDVVRLHANDKKIDKLFGLLQGPESTIKKAIIFDDTQRSVERLKTELSIRGFEVDAIHGGKSQGQRMRALRRFKDSDVTILVATDVAARGIDVPDITHVINYTVPQSYEDYIHRIGRTGRANQVGYALTFVDKQ